MTKPLTLQALYQLVISVLLGGLAFSVRHTDPNTFNLVVGALLVQVTGGTIHLGQQTTAASKSQANGNGSTS